jgi:hypothetical protein
MPKPIGGCARLRIVEIVRQTLSRTKAQVLDITAHNLVALDSRRRSRSQQISLSPEYSNVAGCSIFVVLPHWHYEDTSFKGSPRDTASRPTDRPHILAKCIESLLRLDVDRVVVAVVTNAPNQTARLLASDFAASPISTPVAILPAISALGGPFTDERQVLSIGWSPRRMRRHGRYYLTWAHKALFRRALSDPSFSLLIYMEDDLRFTAEALSYWYRFRKPLASHGLLPGYVRYERHGTSIYVVDQTKPQSLDRPRVLSHAVDDRGQACNRIFLGLDNPYQGMYILDRDLARDHLNYSPARDPLRSLRVQEWGVRERAAMGPIFDDVPSGFNSRNVVPIYATGKASYRLDDSCLVEHMTGNYLLSPDQFGKIRLEDLFVA